jgi:acyl carrier protein
MTHDEIYRQMTEMFRDVFDENDLQLTPHTTADDIVGWDSAAHVGLVVAAETRFGIRFRTAELESLHNVGEFASLIQAKLKGR